MLSIPHRYVPRRGLNQTMLASLVMRLRSANVAAWRPDAAGANRQLPQLAVQMRVHRKGALPLEVVHAAVHELLQSRLTGLHRDVQQVGTVVEGHLEVEVGHRVVVRA